MQLLSDHCATVTCMYIGVCFVGMDIVHVHIFACSFLSAGSLHPTPHVHYGHGKLFWCSSFCGHPQLPVLGLPNQNRLMGSVDNVRRGNCAHSSLWYSYCTCACTHACTCTCTCTCAVPWVSVLLPMSYNGAMHRV